MTYIEDMKGWKRALEHSGSPTTDYKAEVERIKAFLGREGYETRVFRDIPDVSIILKVGEKATIQVDAARRYGKGGDPDQMVRCMESVAVESDTLVKSDKGDLTNTHMVTTLTITALRKNSHAFVWVGGQDAGKTQAIRVQVV